MDVTTILNAVYQYAIDNNGTVPSAITTTATGVCATTGASCATASLIDLGVLTTNGRYLVSMPGDPSTGTSTDTGYTIVRSATTGRVTVAAPGAEVGATISVTR